jgi:hypothetical protein
MYTVTVMNELPKDAVMVVFNPDGSITVYEAGDTLPAIAADESNNA